MPVNAPVFDETILVDTLLDNDENIIESIDDLGSPTLSKVNMGDITSFLAKTGMHQVMNLIFDFLKFCMYTRKKAPALGVTKIQNGKTIQNASKVLFFH